MNLNTKGLNNYSQDILLDNDQKRIYKNSVFVASFFLLVSIILTIIFPVCYTLIIGYALGCLVCLILFNRLTHAVVSTYYQDYGKLVKKIHWMYQLIYLLTYLAGFLIFRDYFIVIGITIGLLTVKMSSILSFYIIKNNK